MDDSAAYVEHRDRISAVQRQSLTYTMHCALFDMNVVIKC